MKLTSTRYIAQLGLTFSTLLLCHIEAAPVEDLSIQAGIHVIHSYPGLTPPPGLLDLTRQGKVGGIILFGENVGANLKDVVNSFQSAYQQSPGNPKSPLLIMTDQEGGQVSRVPGGPTLSEKQIGEAANPAQAATQAGKEAEAALASKNINSNLAPVLGVYRQAGDFLDQFQRSYANTSKIAGDCGSAFITSQQSLGALATAKHFPGLGAAAANDNTDATPVTISLSLSELRSVDEAPYQQAISAGVKMVMTSWALYPALDPKFPSGLSKAWIQGELRGRLGYKGVTISDAIEAGALGSFGNDANRGVLASQAGLDLILASGRNATQGEAIVNALVDALNKGSLPRGPFDAATQRILKIRQGLAA